MLLTFTNPKFEKLIKERIKIHTIRADKRNRWQVGTKIHFWRGNPRNIRAKENHIHSELVKFHGLKSDKFVGKVIFWKNCVLT
jgi:hypothetical protein